MLGIIRRTKSSPIDPAKPEAGQTTRVHYAAKIDPTGVVATWVDNQDGACAVEKPAAEAVIAKTAGRPLAGTIEFLTGPALRYARK